MTDRTRRWIVALLMMMTIAGTSMTAHAETKAERDARMNWWRNARFGMFVHWGLYSIAAGQWGDKRWTHGGMEWIQRRANVPADEYAAKLLPQFHPKANFADAWADLAKAAGCKYVVFTDKHHEGFALHDSAVTKFDAKDVTGRDLCKEITDAIRSRGLHVGVYYSLWDWHEPDAYAGKGTNNPPCEKPEGRDPKKYVDYMHKQVEEIVSNYGPIDVLWFDYSSKEIQGESWGADSLLAMIRKHQPQVIVNNRLYRSEAAGWNDDHHVAPFAHKYGDFCTPEQHIPPTGVPGVDWETCMTINTTWGYSKFDHDWKSSTTLIRNLCDIASKGGNYLLNIGPEADGTIPEPIVTRMHDIGKWMHTNGEAIYGTEASPFAKLPEWGRVTRKGNALYLIVFDWPKDHQIAIPRLANAMTTISMLGDADAKVTLHPEIDRWVIHLPAKAPDASASVIKLDLTSPPVVLGDKPPLINAAADGAVTLASHDALAHGKKLRYEPQPFKNTVGYWMEPDDWAEWRFHTDAAGDYNVILRYGCDKPGGSEIVMHIDDAKLPMTVKDTGGYHHPADQPLGKVHLAAGDHTLSIHATKKAGIAVMDVHQITLKRD